MQEIRQHTLALLVLVLALAGFLLSQSMLLFTAVLAVYLIYKAAPLHRFLSTRACTLILLMLIILCEAPGLLPYYDYEPVTEILGTYLFEPIRSYSPLAIQFSALELGSYGLALLNFLQLARCGDQRRLAATFTAAILIPSACIPGLLWGISQAPEPSLALTQLRHLPLLSAWIIIGANLLQQGLQLKVLFRSLLALISLKSLYALWIYATYFQFDLSQYEYLVDHVYSLLCGSVLFYILVRLSQPNIQAGRRFFLLALLLINGSVFYLNDRRTAWLGLAMAISYALIGIGAKRLARFYRIGLAIAMAVLTTISVLHADRYEAPSDPLRNSIVTESSQSYRQLEDTNLVFSIAESPLLGLGFGNRFKQFFPMPDISMIYELYDAIPHNTLLYLWCFGGPLALAGFTALWSSALRLAKQLYHSSPCRQQQAQVLVLASILIQWLCQVIFDQGLVLPQALLLAGFALGALIQLSHQQVTSEPQEDQP